MRVWAFAACLAVALLGVPRASAGSAAPADLIFGQPAKLVDVGGFKLNIRCIGTGSPTVIFDAGWGDWSPAWATVQPIVAGWTRTCSYDRAGGGFSDAGPFPRTSLRIVRELHTLLQRAGEKPPFVLVGHSFGAFNMRLYADYYLPDVAGIVLVDGGSENQKPLMPTTWLSANTRDLKTCEREEVGGFHGTAKQRATCLSLYFRGFPEKKWSPQLNAIVAGQALTIKQDQATLSEAQGIFTASGQEVRESQRSYGHIPLRILVATNHHFDVTNMPTPTSRAYWRHWEATWVALHRAWLPFSTNSKLIMAPGSGHYIQFDRPDVFLKSMKEVIATVRSGG